MEAERVPLSTRYPWLYGPSVAFHRTVRRAHNLNRHHHARRRPEVATPHPVAAHGSILLRRLAGVDMELQENKRSNLELAVPPLDGRVIRPGEHLSFWRCIGNPTARRGYLPGLVLHADHLAAGVGGGLCQLSNLIYWLVLHTPLTVVEHHHHGNDVFPDSGRVLPFGSGATVFFNYVDLVIRNDTADDYRLHLWLTDEELRGEFLAAALPPLAYHVREEDHRFFRDQGRVHRENRLYQVAVDRRTGAEVSSRLIRHNIFPVLYEVEPALVEDEQPAAMRSRP